MTRTHADTIMFALACDDEWSRELEHLFGKKAGDVRYTAEGKGSPGSALRTLHEAKLAADRVAHESFVKLRAK